MKSKLYIILPVIWLSGFIFIFPDPFLFVVRDGVCIYILGDWDQTLAILINIYYAFTNFIVPGLTMLFLYAHMALVIWRSRQSRKEMISSKSNKNDVLGKAQINIFFTCIILLILYFTCWCWNITNTFVFMAGLVPFSMTYFHVSALFILFNSVINPFIYTVRYDEFQHHLKLLFTKNTTSTRTIAMEASTTATH